MTDDPETNMPEPTPRDDLRRAPHAPTPAIFV